MHGLFAAHALRSVDRFLLFPEPGAFASIYICMFQTRRASTYLVIGLLAFQLIALLAVALVTLPGIAQWHALDLSIYYQDSLQLLRGRIPYRDFALEYPPLALLPFVLPRLATFGLRIDFSD